MLSRWLEKEACGKQLYGYLAGFVVAGFLWDVIAAEILYLLGIDFSSLSKTEKNIPMLTLTFPLVLIAGALLEEVLFRLPLAFAVHMGWSVNNILAGAFVLSILFGALHGGAPHILVQGGSGFLYSLLFLKCGGYQRKYLKALATASTAHFLHNGMIVIALIAGGETVF